MSYDIEEIARLLGALPPVPEGWVAAAQQLPRARAAFDSLLERAAGDAELRQRLVADLEAALAEAGIVATPSFIELARERLQSP
jgi:2-hydroxychromene-2-carboxylate isomerase